MKNRITFSLFTLILVILGMFAACADPAQPQPNYTVKFEANGGSPAPSPQIIPHGGKVVQPPAMTKTGYDFGGWYKEAACINQWDFAADTVTDNITLYARWGSPGSFNFTVTFNANGGSPAPDPQIIPHGDTVVQPPAMTKTDYIFGGWYKEEACTNQWNFAADTVSGNITLYALWNTPIPVSGTTLAAKLQWLSANAASNSGYILEVTTVYEALAPQYLSYSGKSNITIQLKGTGSSRTIDLSGNGSLFSIGDGVTLILDENLVLQGRNNNTASLISVNGGTLIMNRGAKITGNTAAASFGGGVYVGGTFTMNGGEISGNSGGGVSVGQNGTFTMSGGEISGNSNGGVSVGQNGTFTMNGGEISDNSDRGVYVDGGTFTMEGGEISGNTGGGVSVNYNGTFTMSGGEISGNTGGGVYVGGTFTMNGGEISGNTASYGGGVYVGGTFTMNSGEISGNTAYYYGGGGVYVHENGTFTKSGGGTITGYASDTVNGNVVKDDYDVVQNDRGHAVYVDSDPARRRETTAGPGVDLYSRVDGTLGGWED